MWFFKTKEDRALETATLRLQYIQLWTDVAKQSGGLTEEDKERFKKELDETFAMISPPRLTDTVRKDKRIS